MDAGRLVGVGLVALSAAGISSIGRAQEGAGASAEGRDPARRPYETLSFEGEVVELPLVLARSQVLVDDVWVNGEGPLRFVLDTGAMGAGPKAMRIASIFSLSIMSSTNSGVTATR